MTTDFSSGDRTYYVSDETAARIPAAHARAEAALGGRTGDVFAHGESRQGKAAGNFEAKQIRLKQFDELTVGGQRSKMHHLRNQIHSMT